jgi:hypothetical protein
MTFAARVRATIVSSLVSVMFTLSTPTDASEPITVGLLQGWYVVQGGEPDESIRARMFGEYQSGGKTKSGRNVLTYTCKKGWRDYLRVNLAPEVKHMIATARQDMKFGFTDTIRFVGQQDSAEWVAWYDSESDSAVIEFPDTNEELIKRRFDLFLLLASDFIVEFGPIKDSAVPFRYLSPGITQKTIKQLERGFNKKLELQDRLQFLSYCTQLQF